MPRRKRINLGGYADLASQVYPIIEQINETVGSAPNTQIDQQLDELLQNTLQLLQQSPINEIIDNAATDALLFEKERRKDFVHLVLGQNFSDEDYNVLDAFVTGFTNPRSGLNYFAKRMWETKTTRFADDLRKVNEEIKNYKRLKEYADLLDKLHRHDIAANINNITGLGENEYDNKYLLSDDELNATISRISELLNYFKTDGKKSDIVIDALWNFNKNWDQIDKLDLFRRNIINSEGLQNLLNDDTSWYDVTNYPNTLLNAASATASFVSNLIRTGYEGIGKLLPNTVSSQYTRRAVKNSDVNDKTFDVLFDNHMYDESGNFRPQTESIRNVLNSYSDYLQRKKNESELNLKEAYDHLQKGNFLFNPNNIDEHFLDIAEANPTGFWGSSVGRIINPSNLTWLGFGEMGSSYSDIETMATLIGTDTGAQLIMSNLPEGLSKILNPYVAVVLTAANLYFTSLLRRHETASESMDALSNRVLQDASDRKIDLIPVLLDAAEYGKSIGINTDNMTSILLLQLALAFNTPTENIEYQKLLDEARPGLKYLENINNQLAIEDYITAFPYLNYQRSVFRDLAKRTPSTAKIGTKFSEDLMFSNPKYASLVDQSFTSSVDRQVTRIGNKIFKNPASINQLRRVGNYAANKLKNVVQTGVWEGGEEGVLHVLQQEYQKGNYDDYNGSYNIFSSEDASTLPSLLFDSWLWYFGLDSSSPYNGDSELRKAMQLGFVSGGMQSVMGRSLREKGQKLLTFSTVGSDPSQIMGIDDLFFQIKNDQAIKSLIGEKYGAQQDAEHIGIFYDALSKFGVTQDRLAESLNALKQNKGVAVKDEYIDRDINMLNLTSSYRNNKLRNEELEDRLNIIKNSDTHKLFVLTAVKYRMLLNDRNVVERQNNKDYLSQILSIEEAILDEDESNLDPITSGIRNIIKNDYKENTEIERKLAKSKATEDVLQQLDLERDAAFVNGEDVYEQPSESEINDRISKKQKEIEDLIISEKQFTHQLLFNIFSYNELKNTRRLINSLLTLKLFLSTISDELGMDLNLGEMNYILQYLIRHENLLKRNSEKLLEDVNKLVDKLNEQLEALSKETGEEYEKYSRKTVDDIFSKYGLFANQDEIDKIILADLLNAATKQLLHIKNSAFTNGIAHPEDVYEIYKTPTWNQLSSEQRSEYIEKVRRLYEQSGKSDQFTKDKARRQYVDERNKKQQKYNELYNNYIEARNKFQDQDDNATLDDMDYHDLFRIAGDMVVENELLIARTNRDNSEREYRNSQPITPNDIADAKDGDENAQDKISQQLLDLLELADVQPDDPTLDLNQQDQSLLDDLINQDMTDEEQQLNSLIHNDKPSAKQKRLLKQHDLAENLKSDQNNKEKDQEDKEDGDLTQVLSDVIVNEDEGNPQIIGQSESNANEDKQDDDLSQDEVLELPENLEDDELTNVLSGSIIDESEDSHDVTSGPTTAVENTILEDLEGENDHLENDDEEGQEEDDTEDDGGQDVEDVVYGEPDQMLPEDDSWDLLESSLSEEDLDLLQLEQLSLLDLDDDGSWDVGITIYEDPDKKDLQEAQVSDDVRSNWTASTFFFRPDSDKPVSLSVNKKQLKTKYPVKPGKLLAKKLLEKGWFESCDKYYVVSGNPDEKGYDNADNFTVSLVIDDDNNKSTYIATLGTPSNYRWYNENTHDWVTEDGLEKIRQRLQKIGLNDKDGSKLNKAVLKQREAEYQRYNPHDAIPERSDYSSDKEYLDALDGFYRRAKTWYLRMKPTDPIRSEIYERARLSLAKPGSKVLSNSEIELQIEQLKLARLEIISAYCTKTLDGKWLIPEEIKTTVKPLISSVSNGRINTNERSEDDKPAFKTLAGRFGISDDIVEITEQIQQQQIKFGYGLGLFGDPRFNILQLGTNTVLHDKRGWSGKMFMMIDTRNNTQVPIMLHEAKFNLQHMKNGKTKYVNEASVTLAIDPKTGKINSEDAIPSAAEVLLYLITGKLHISNLPNERAIIDKDGVMGEFLNLFVNSGANTDRISSNKKQFKNLPQFVSKIFNYKYDEKFTTSSGLRGAWILRIGDVKGPVPTVREYTNDDLFGDNSEELRKIVISHIARHMHWNTDKAFMIDEFPLLIRNILRSYFLENPKATEFSLCGVPEFLIKKEDLFDVDDNGDITDDKNISTLAWMIKNQKLETDVADQPFVDPFVFASGVQKSVANETIDQVKQLQNPEKEEGKPISIDGALSVNQVRFMQEKVNRALGIVKMKGFNLKLLFIESEEDRKQKMNDLNRIDSIILDVDPSVAKQSLDKFKQEIDAAVNRYLEHINKSRKDKITPAQIVYSSSLFAQYGSFKNGMTIPTLIMSKDGTGTVFLQAPQQVKNMVKYVTGVFSTEKSSGKLNEKKTRKWLNKTLGIDDKLIIITDAVLKSTSDLDVYGLTGIATDILSGGVFGYFTFRRNAGRGISYHEAFHYVNLLLHNPRQRFALYKAYAERYPQFKNKPLHEIEEAMAEDFRTYMEDRNEGNVFKRVWNLFLDFIKIFKKKDLVDIVFKEIRSGKYKHNTTLDQESVEQFKKKYPYGAASANFVVPGTKQSDLNFKVIDNYRTFYDVAESLSHAMLEMFSIKTTADLDRFNSENNKLGRFYKKLVEYNEELLKELEVKSIKDLKDLESDKFNHIFKTLKDNKSSLLEEFNILSGDDILSFVNLHGIIQLFFDTMRELSKYADPIQRSLLDDVFNNISAFKYVLTSMLKLYGIEPKYHKQQSEKLDSTNKEKLQDDGQPKDSGDRADNIYDIDHLTISEKDNVAFRAKLFLSLVKKMYPYLDNGVRQWEYEDDGMFGSKYYSFGETWNTILKHLWQCRSWDEIDKKTGKYSRSSVLGTVYRLAKSQRFFRSLKENLEAVGDDLQLQNQILATVKKYMTQFAYINITDPKIFKSSEYDEASGDYIEKNAVSLSDRRRVWEIQNDNKLRAVSLLPRDWSKAAAVSGLFKLTSYGNVIDLEYAKILQSDLNDIIQELKSYKVFNNQEDAIEAYNNIADKIITLLHKMSIPFDEAVFDRYIDMHIDNLSYLDNYVYRFNVVKNIFSVPIKGNINYIINGRNNKSSIMSLAKTGKTFIPIPGNKSKELSELYTGYKKSKKDVSEPEIKLMAAAYDDVYPSSEDFSVLLPSGTMGYPISENNSISDDIQKLNYNIGDIQRRLKKSPYTNNSILRLIVENTRASLENSESRLKLNAFTGIKSDRDNNGEDYFEITPMEDYISKMMMTFKNMLTLPTMADKKTWYSISGNGLKTIHDIVTYENRVFSEETLNVFEGYFLDELNSLEQYYSRDVIAHFVKHPDQAIKNFHGEIKNGRMDFSGNGGLFRYFYDINTIKDKGSNVGYNLNQLLELRYNFQKEIENNPGAYGGIAALREEGYNRKLDGFELVRSTIKSLKDYYTGSAEAREILRSDINKWLNKMVDKEMQNISTADMQILSYNNGTYLPWALPNEILEYYAERMLKEDVIKHKVRPYRDMRNNPNLVLSAISSHVASSMMSIIELEKVFSGDPAFYKLQNLKDLDKKDILLNVSADVLYNGTKHAFSTKLHILLDKSDDKIKRLGALLSPGTNIRTQYNKTTLIKSLLLSKQDAEYLLKDTYTNLNIADIGLVSRYLDDMKVQFGKQVLIDEIRNNPNAKWIMSYLKKSGYNNTTLLIDRLYLSNNEYEKIKAVIPNELLLKDIKEEEESSSNPYSNINVSDALVIIRPAMYRKLKIGLGLWSFDEDDTGYSDEKAYKILLEDGSWMHDPEKAKMVRRFEALPLKMTYFSNDPTQILLDSGRRIQFNLPIYNKMAIFPMFKYLSTSNVGKKIYTRMNLKGHELDMISFESAVKVGLTLNIYSPYKNGVQDLSSIDESIDNTDRFVLILRIDGLRLQLNTESHTATDRSIGTQMFKIAFSNIVEKERYGLNSGDYEGKTTTKTGKEIKYEIMHLINALTYSNVIDVEIKYFDGDIPNKKAIDRLIRRIIKTQDLGAVSEDLFNSGGTVSSLMSRQVFELGVNSEILKKIVDINTKGGSAVQQSIFGWTGYSDEENNYHLFNNGEQLLWNARNGSMEVMLSLNFFKSIIPRSEQTTYTNMRQWLIEHDIIKGKKLNGEKSKPNPYGIGYRIPTQGMSSMFGFIVADVLPELSGDLIIVPEEFTAQTGSDFDVDKIYIATLSYDENGKLITLSDEELVDILNITENNFHNIVKDINKDAIVNQLLLNYLTIVTDIKNFSQSRASIDTLTNILKREILPNLKEKPSYKSGGYELLPSFQSRRKLEFTTGKDGIGPFALNVTNLALTLFTHLTMDYGINEFNFGNLDEIKGLDGKYISGWLSAMINAHVDVARDPYIFDLNINKTTYNHVNFLLRAGKGKATFTFIAQPILKEYALLTSSSKGIYGNNLLGKKEDKKFGSLENKIVKDLTKKYLDLFKQANSDGLHELEIKYYKNQIDLLIQNENEADWSKAFDYNEAIKALLNPNSILSLYFQILTLKSFFRMLPYTQELADLVKVSKVDTKKFGNNIASHLNFLNTYNQFMFGEHAVSWYINDNENSIKNYKTIHLKEGESYPFRKYFKTLFIDSKLQYSTKFVRDILRNLIYVATDTFEELFNAINILTKGAVNFTIQKHYNGEIKSTVKTGYKEISDDKLVLNIKNAIDNVIRYRVLQNVGSKDIKLTDDFTGPIDFTCGGDVELVNKTIERLVFGEAEDKNNKNQKPRDTRSLFENVARLIEYVEEYPLSESAEGIVDPMTGRVKNEFLLFLKPQPASDRFPIGRMLLKKSQMLIAVEDKQILVSAFDALLRHKSKEVRRLAREVAFYAYYSTYDQNSTFSFFDLVPAYFRQQYDKALAKGLKYGKRLLISAISSTQDVLLNKNISWSIANLQQDLLDIISRNYWYDDNIVPIYYETGKGRQDLLKFYGDHRFNEYSVMINRQRVYPAILTKLADSLYIKIRKPNGDVYLYKRVGSINKSDSKGKGINVYIIAPKLGLHEGRIHYYEFAADKRNSMFVENDLPQTFKPENVLNIILDYISQYEDFKLNIESNISYEGYYFNNVLVGSQDNNFNSNKTIKFVETANPDDYLSKLANLIVDINTNKHSEKKGSVSIKYDDSIEKQVDEILKDVSIETTNSIPLSIYFNGGDISINITNELIDDYIDKLVLNYKERVLQDNDRKITPENLNEQIDNYKKDLSAVASIIVRQNILNEYMSNLINEIINRGATIGRIVSDGQTGIGEASAIAGSLLIDDFALDYNTVAHPKKMTDEEKDQFRSKFDENNDDYLSENEKQEVETISQQIEEGDKIIEQIDKEKKLVDEKVNEEIALLSTDSSEDAGFVDVNDFLNSFVDTFTYTWAVSDKNSYEVSTKGDSRFSALVAKFNKGTVIEGVDVGGKTIEYVYLNIIKKSSKGKAPSTDSILNIDSINIETISNLENIPKSLIDKILSYVSNNNNKLTKLDMEDFSYYRGYLPLWKIWSQLNKDLILELKENAKDKILTDRFANKTVVSQARALALILNEDNNPINKECE